MDPFQKYKKWTQDPNKIQDFLNQISTGRDIPIEITHDSFLFSVAQGIFWLSTERLTQYITFLKRRERRVCTLVLCSLTTVTFCIDPPVRIVTKSPKVEPLLIFSISLSTGNITLTILSCSESDWVWTCLTWGAPPAAGATAVVEGPGGPFPPPVIPSTSIPAPTGKLSLQLLSFWYMHRDSVSDPRWSQCGILQLTSI